MTTSDPIRVELLARLSASQDFLTHLGMTKNIPVLEGDSDELKAMAATLNTLFLLVFPQINASRREKTFTHPAPPQDAFTLLEDLAPSISHHGLRARAYEQLWAYRPGKPNPKDAIAAAEAYLQHLPSPSDSEQERDANDEMSTLERALRLSAVYASHPDGKPVYLAAQQRALQDVRDAARDPNTRGVKLRAVLSTLKKVPGSVLPQDLLNDLAQLDQAQLAVGNFTWRQQLAELRLALTAQMDPAERIQARQHYAQVMEAKGDAEAVSNPVAAKQAYMCAERLYIDLNMTSETLKMRLKGAALGNAIQASMKPILLDVSDYAAFSKTIAEKRVQEADSLGAYLRALAEHHAVQPKTPDESTGRSLYAWFGQLHFGSGGQIVNPTGDSGEPGFKLDEMQWHAQLSAILNAHLWDAAQAQWAPSENELFALVAASPTVPEHIRTLITRGFLHALQRDALVASSLLAPMPEAILRHTLENKGELAPHTDPTHVQMSTTLGALLEGAPYESLQQHFGADLMLDVKRVLDTESLNVRNTMLHGLGGDLYAQDWPGRALIQLMFRLVFGAHPGVTTAVISGPA